MRRTHVDLLQTKQIGVCGKSACAVGRDIVKKVARIKNFATNEQETD